MENKKVTSDSSNIKKHIEFSKLLCSLSSIGLAGVGIWMIWKYYDLVQYAIASSSISLPDSALPITGITAIISPIIGYLTYQFGLKSSRNKHGIDANGNLLEHIESFTNPDTSSTESEQSTDEACG